MFVLDDSHYKIVQTKATCALETFPVMAIQN